jgi:hypothetical protein
MIYYEPIYGRAPITYVYVRPIRLYKCVEIGINPLFSHAFSIFIDRTITFLRTLTKNLIHTGKFLMIFQLKITLIMFPYNFCGFRLYYRHLYAVYGSVLSLYISDISWPNGSGYSLFSTVVHGQFSISTPPMHTHARTHTGDARTHNQLHAHINVHAVYALSNPYRWVTVCRTLLETSQLDSTCPTYGWKPGWKLRFDTGLTSITKPVSDLGRVRSLFP